MRKSFQVDWFRVITDLNSCHITTVGIAKLINIPENTILGWKNADREPRYSSGHKLVGLWCEKTNKTLEQLPQRKF